MKNLIMTRYIEKQKKKTPLRKISQMPLFFCQLFII